jgi:hypothetical protein
MQTLKLHQVTKNISPMSKENVHPLPGSKAQLMKKAPAAIIE